MELVQLAKGIEARGTSGMARRILQVVGMVSRYAAAHGLREACAILGGSGAFSLAPRMRSVMKKKPSQKSAAKKKTAPASSAEMEKMMRALAGMIEGEDGIVTAAGLHALVASLNNPSAHDGLSDAEADAKDEVQQIAFDAMEAKTDAEARKLAKRALKLDSKDRYAQRGYLERDLRA